MDQKPIKLDYTTGELQQFQNGDTLPIETTVAILTDLFNRLLVDYYKQGFTPQDQTLLTQLQTALQTT